MQFSAVEIRFIVTTLLYSTFANDLKRKDFFRKMFIVTEYAALNDFLCKQTMLNDENVSLPELPVFDVLD